MFFFHSQILAFIFEFKFSTCELHDITSKASTVNYGGVTHGLTYEIIIMSDSVGRAGPIFR